jgi:hypothetical protein
MTGSFWRKVAMAAFGKSWRREYARRAIGEGAGAMIRATGKPVRDKAGVFHRWQFAPRNPKILAT